MKKIEIRTVMVSEAYTNCYLVKNTESGEGFIVDPGDDETKINAHIARMEMKPVAILLTHGHFDHMGAAQAIKDRYHIPIYASKEEEKTLLDTKWNLTFYHYETPITLHADRYLSDGEIFTAADITMKFILTPGHTPGSGCFYLEENHLLFSGDTLFCASRGRTDFPGGSEAQIIKSIREKLLVLPEETDVLPGHMEQTTIGAEKIYYWR